RRARPPARARRRRRGRPRGDPALLRADRPPAGSRPAGGADRRRRDRAARARPGRMTKILFATRRREHRRFVALIGELAKGGHEIVIAFPSSQRQRIKKPLRPYANVRLDAYDEVTTPEYGDAIALLRETRDYGWYLSPGQQVATYNRTRALGQLLTTATGVEQDAPASWPDPAVDLDAAVQATLDTLIGGLD